jgi:hypothetical protein
MSGRKKRTTGRKEGKWYFRKGSKECRKGAMHDERSK